MELDQIFLDARSVITVISFITFLGIIWWTYGMHRRDDFDAAARLPLEDDAETPRMENNRV
ncbi:cytochrome c oxidase cbb3-type subunit 4 [Noviherbaspirillum humi]|uniref:Cytochrome c oxidase cbb3-type subunit 4 n=1 Tax=Noviherbaspirillum humi TaxID=1688639 RepID=A0A239ITS4_9BURK|nr:cbb3-type cytochrome c oxidase subunit 3 [Noviherbaspirillum humi]SNS96991.1 cytochrome c oxidase cbb3-type subunit 4 [Noviherbaspirillum humi]